MMNSFILLAEDNDDHAALIQRAFHQSGLRGDLVRVGHGEEALDFLYGRGNYTGRDTSSLPSLVVLDLKMPKVSGLEVLVHIRSEQLTKCLPVVMLTTSDEKRDVTACYVSGANSYVRKPVGFSEFTDVVREIGRYWLDLNVPADATGAP